MIIRRQQNSANKDLKLFWKGGGGVCELYWAKKGGINAIMPELKIRAEWDGNLQNEKWLFVFSTVWIPTFMSDKISLHFSFILDKLSESPSQLS